jgi:tetratricopeptide (TPR) repeat protein
LFLSSLSLFAASVLNTNNQMTSTNPNAGPELETPIADAVWNRLYDEHTSGKANKVTTGWKALAISLLEEMRELERKVKPCQGASLNLGSNAAPSEVQPLDGSGKGTPEIIDPEGLKGGPGAQAKLREYYGKFRALGDNPPMVVAENGEAILSMMWPVHEQTPEGEKAAVEYTSAFATKIAELLNTGPDLATLLTRAETAERERAEFADVVDSFQLLLRKFFGDDTPLAQSLFGLPNTFENVLKDYRDRGKAATDLRAKLEAAEAERKEAAEGQAENWEVILKLRAQIKELETKKSELCTMVTDASQKRDELASALATAQREREEAEAWKESALQVESRWDCQAVAKLLNLRPGEDIRPNIEPKIRNLISERDAALAQVAELEKKLTKVHKKVDDISKKIS